MNFRKFQFTNLSRDIMVKPEEAQQIQTFDFNFFFFLFLLHCLITNFMQNSGICTTLLQLLRQSHSKKPKKQKTTLSVGHSSIVSPLTSYQL